MDDRRPGIHRVLDAGLSVVGVASGPQLLIAGPLGLAERATQAMGVFFPGSSRAQRKFKTEFLELAAGAQRILGPLRVTHLDYRTLDDHRPRLTCKRMIVTHMSSDMLARVVDLPIEAAHDGLEVVL